VEVADRYWLETLGCPKNQVDSAKLAGSLTAGGYEPASGPDEADLVVVNTCAFIEAARQESIDTILELATARRDGARLVVTGCMAERYGDELAAALPEVDRVAGFGVPLVGPLDGACAEEGEGAACGAVPAATVVAVPGPARRSQPSPGAPPRSGRGLALAVRPTPAFDLLELPRPAASAPWAYVKVAEGCDRRCGFCAIPSFRGPQRSRSVDAVLAEVDALGPGVREVVLVAQDLASWGHDRTGSGLGAVAVDADAGGDSGGSSSGGRRGAARPLVDLVDRLSRRVERVRLLYLYPSSLDDALVAAIVGTGIPYFDLSLQHVSRPHVQRMRRWGDGDRFLERIAAIRAAAPDAALRSSFIVGYPGETEEDHDQLLAFLGEARLDWAGFFTFSPEPGTYAAGLGGIVPGELAMERLRECAEVQDAITEEKRRALVGQSVEVLVDSPGAARSWREAPEIDGIVHVPADLAVGEIHQVQVQSAAGPDVWAEAAP
jgi:ribosomal protein S12 methylthiotransferase